MNLYTYVHACMHKLVIILQLKFVTNHYVQEFDSTIVKKRLFQSQIKQGK